MKTFKAFAIGASVLTILATGTLSGADNMIENGEFEGGGLPEFTYMIPPENLTWLEAPPFAEKETAKNPCLQANLTGERDIVYFKLKIEVDPTQIYRVSLKFASDVKVGFTMGGYGNDSEKQVLNVDGVVWQYSLRAEDGGFVPETPTSGWTTMQTTIGPEGSGADYQWDPRISWVGFGIWLSPGEPGKLYLDDLKFEQIDKL